MRPSSITRVIPHPTPDRGWRRITRPILTCRAEIAPKFSRFGSQVAKENVPYHSRRLNKSVIPTAAERAALNSQFAEILQGSPKA